MNPQIITAPDGSELVVITRQEFDRLTASQGAGSSEDVDDIAAAERALADGDDRYPPAVVDAMIAGETPIAAWRKYRGISQAALANKSGITQAAISRLERTGEDHPQPLGRRITRQAIARALNVPLSLLEPLGD